MDLLSWDTAVLVLLGTMFLAGGVVGCLAANRIQGEAGTALLEYLNAFFSLSSETGLDVGFWDVVWEQLRFPLLVLILGFTAVGTIGIPAAFGLRGFLFSYSVACLFRLFGWPGAAPALFLFGLPALLWAPALFIMGNQAMGASCAMLRCCLGDGQRPGFFEGSYWFCCALCAGAVALCVALEYWVLPSLVGASAGFVL